MKQFIFLLFTLTLLTSCDRETNSIINNSVKQNIHQNLLGFKTSFLAEIGDDNFENLESKSETDEIEIKYLNDIIYVSYLKTLNACGIYEGNIDINNDTIKLNVNLISDELCSSLSVEKVTFLIDNIDEKKKVILKNHSSFN